MNAREHALTGIAAGVLTTPLAVATGTPPPVWVAGFVAGSIAPDADHPGATIAGMWGPLSLAFVRPFSAVMGGHRGLTHRRAGVAALAVALLAANAHSVALGVAWACIVGIGLAAAGRALRHRVTPALNLAVSALVGAAATGATDVSGPWPTYGVAGPVIGGVIVHLLGDTVPVESRRAAAVAPVSYIVIGGWAVWPLLVTIPQHLT